MKTKHSLYFTWQNMHARCRNPNAPSYKRYGGRGIAVCERWISFETFVSDIGPKPTPLHTLDRRDNSRGYSPDNCRWATRKEQARNVDRNRIAVIAGVEYKAADLADLCGLDATTIVQRAKKGLSYEQVISPRRRAKPDNLEQIRELAWAKRRNQTHCKRGHEFTPENTYFDKRGSRVCRECVNAKGRAWRAKRQSP